MESTGIYWIPVYELLTGRGFEVILANARDAKNVRGRKTDINDAQWLQRLHTFGLLRGSFQPAQEVASLRAYLRQRERLLEYAAAHIQHMQKALMEMNPELYHVVTDITGKTGMRILRAIAAGKRDPAVLASSRDPRCTASMETIEKALTGHYRDEQIEEVLQRLCENTPTPLEPLPRARHADKNPNAPAFDIRAALYAMLGIDLTQIQGLGPYLALKLVGECGTDMAAKYGSPAISRAGAAGRLVVEVNSSSHSRSKNDQSIRAVSFTSGWR